MFNRKGKIQLPFWQIYSNHAGFLPPSNRVESTDSLRSRIRDLETECKKLTMDMKLKEEQIRDLEGKCQVRRKDLFFRRPSRETERLGFSARFKHFPSLLCTVSTPTLPPTHTLQVAAGRPKHSHYGPTHLLVRRTDLCFEVRKMERGVLLLLC